MLSTSSSRVARTGPTAARHVAGQRVITHLSRGSVRVGSGQEGFFSDAFKSALQTAMERDQSQAAGMYSSALDSSRDYGYSRSEGTSAYRPPAPSQASPAGPLLQILATALGQSRATLERLQIEESEIENLIQRERKQVERLEWLLEKVQQDYAYFDQLQKRFEGEASYNQGDSRYDQGGSRHNNGSSSSSSGGGGGRWGL